MRFIDKLCIFKKKVDSSVVSANIEPIVEPTPPKLTSTNSNRKIRECNHCHKNIMPEDKYSKQAGDYYHRRCWRDLVKSVSRVI